ncbi:MAG: FAD-dependent oxidoreductase, partial [Verrucomicrobiota bacterium]
SFLTIPVDRRANMETKSDVVVIGGGPAGATAALLLAQAGWSVALIEKARFPRKKVCGEFLSATNFPLLRRLGVASVFRELAGPEIRRVGLFAGDAILSAAMPHAAHAIDGWGRALGREHLDTLLLERAEETGAQIWQPWAATELVKEGEEHVCKIVSKETDGVRFLRSPIVVAAHGSWEPGTLPTQRKRQATRRSDLLGFKAHFHECDLAPGLMPLLAFPGGYGGMVHTDHDRVSLSCCIKRDQLQRIRERLPGARATEGVLAHIRTECRGVNQALAQARLDGAWLSAGPIQPGIRFRAGGGIFAIGNAAGEAHPVIAEGISMAMQSAWVLCDLLIPRRREVLSGNAITEISREYVAAWRKGFAGRIRVAAGLAQLIMRPAAGKISLPILKLFPEILSLGARMSGKVAQIVPRS